LIPPVPMVTLRFVQRTKVGSAAFSYNDSSMLATKPHGCAERAHCRAAAQIKTGSNTLAIASSGSMMWDYLRLEWVTP